MKSFFHYIIKVIILIKICDCLAQDSLEKTYDKAVKAYSDERWSRCIEKFEESLHIYKLFKSVIMNCRLKCNTQHYEPRVKENIEDLKIYETFFNKRNCVSNCLEDGFRRMNLNSYPDEYVLGKMHSKTPYEYLHICYFQMNMFQKAASAAFTYLLAHPEDESMISNVHYYLEQPEVQSNEVVDLEGDDYVLLYNLGRKSYNRNNWAETVANLEEAIREYISTENLCRMECEQQPGQEWSSEFVITLSNNMASLLHCRQLCQDKLNLLKYNSGIEFLGDILNYLQMSYYHLEKFEDAAEAVATHQIIIENDEDMIENEKFYDKLIDKKVTSKRSDIIHYFKRDSYEKDLLRFFHKENKNNIGSNLV